MKKNLKVKIIYEDENVAVIDKPAGIMAHSDGRKEEYTLADWLKESYPKSFPKEVASNPSLKEGQGWASVGEIGREGVVHRLDTGTTGVMIFALNRDSFNFLKKQFQAHTTKKIYHAIVAGHIKNDTGIIDSPISRSRSDFRKKNTKDVFTNDGKGDVRGKERDAVTRYKVLARLKNKSGKPFTFVECRPETGRTHQIRVHLKSIRHPIIGDDLYGVGEIERVKVQNEFKIKLSRPMLHAYSLTIKIPVPPASERGVKPSSKKSEEKTFVAKEHLDMRKVLEEMGYRI